MNSISSGRQESIEMPGLAAHDAEACLHMLGPGKFEAMASRTGP